MGRGEEEVEWGRDEGPVGREIILSMCNKHQQEDGIWCNQNPPTTSSHVERIIVRTQLLWGVSLVGERAPTATICVATRYVDL